MKSTRSFTRRGCKSCEKFTSCYRSIYESDFLERQWECLQEKATCARSDKASCEELAGKTYSAGASFAASCSDKKASCKKTGVNVDLGCDSLAGLKSTAAAKAKDCFDEDVPCKDVVSCLITSFGGDCKE